MAKERALIVTKVDAPPEHEDKWNHWYNSKHVPLRLVLPGFLSACRFQLIEGVPEGIAVESEPKYLALWDIIDSNVLNSDPYLKLRAEEKALPADSFEAVTATIPKISRAVYRQTYPEQSEYKPFDAKYVFLLGFDEAPGDKTREFEEWFNMSVTPALSHVPGFLRARNFVLAREDFPPMLAGDVPLPKYLSVYDISNQSVFAGETFRKAKVSTLGKSPGKWVVRSTCAAYRRIWPNPA